MKPLRLYIKDFMCYDRAFVDFDEFSSALIVGKTEGNDMEANGVGKTTIFRAIEFVLFGYSDAVLEGIIRDDADSCSIGFDFEVGEQVYRLTRKRTRKGVADLSLYLRNGVEGTSEEALHTDDGLIITDKKYWQDKSSRTAAATEKELAKLLKINLKSFRVIVHFMQHDFTGLATATPEKRKLILKEALNLAVYSKLEKIAKDKLSALSKEADRLNALMEGLGDPDQAMIGLSQTLSDAEQQIVQRLLAQANIEAAQTQLSDKINRLTAEHSNLESKFSTLIAKQKDLTAEKARTEISVKEYHTKKTNIIKQAHEIVAELKELEATQVKLIGLDFNQIDILTNQIVANKEKAAQLSLTIQNDMAQIEVIKVPMPGGPECEQCHQPITAEHRKYHQQKRSTELREKQSNIQSCKKEMAALTAQNTVHQQNINSLMLSKQHLEELNVKIATKKKDLADRRETHKDYQSLYDKFNEELQTKNKELEEIEKELQSSSLAEAQAVERQIQAEKKAMDGLNIQATTLNKELIHFNNVKAVVQHDLNQKQEDKRKKLAYTKLIKELDEKIKIYPSVVQAFSSTGIPNLIIQNVLDDLQTEANALISQLKPGLQIAFVVEKTQGNGTEADTLDIHYQVNGKKRYYETLSGAMQFIVNFSLRIGLSFFLQKTMGIDLRFLLLDEIDQSLDKMRTDVLADIVKFFQKDFKILVISHNDRMKDKFSHAILVEQDIHGVSSVKVVSSW